MLGARQTKQRCTRTSRRGVHARIEGLAQMWPALWMGFNAKFASSLHDGGVEAGELISAYHAMLRAAL